MILPFTFSTLQLGECFFRNGGAVFAKTSSLNVCINPVAWVSLRRPIGR